VTDGTVDGFYVRDNALLELFALPDVVGTTYYLYNLPKLLEFYMTWADDGADLAAKQIYIRNVGHTVEDAGEAPCARDDVGRRRADPKTSNGGVTELPELLVCDNQLSALTINTTALDSIYVYNVPKIVRVRSEKLTQLRVLTLYSLRLLSRVELSETELSGATEKPGHLLVYNSNSVVAVFIKRLSGVFNRVQVRGSKVEQTLLVTSFEELETIVNQFDLQYVALYDAEALITPVEPENPGCDIYPGVDFKQQSRNNIAEINKISSADECEQRCIGFTGCEAFSYLGSIKRCWLKRAKAISNAQARPGFISGDCRAAQAPPDPVDPPTEYILDLPLLQSTTQFRIVYVSNIKEIHAPLLASQLTSGLYIQRNSDLELVEIGDGTASVEVDYALYISDNQHLAETPPVALLPGTEARKVYVYIQSNPFASLDVDTSGLVYASSIYARAASGLNNDVLDFSGLLSCGNLYLEYTPSTQVLIGPSEGRRRETGPAIVYRVRIIAMADLTAIVAPNLEARDITVDACAKLESADLGKQPADALYLRVKNTFRLAELKYDTDHIGGAASGRLELSNLRNNSLCDGGIGELSIGNFNSYSIASSCFTQLTMNAVPTSLLLAGNARLEDVAITKAGDNKLDYVSVYSNRKLATLGTNQLPLAAALRYFRLYDAATLDATDAFDFTGVVTAAYINLYRIGSAGDSLVLPAATNVSQLYVREIYQQDLAAITMDKLEHMSSLTIYEVKGLSSLELGTDDNRAQFEPRWYRRKEYPPSLSLERNGAIDTLVLPQLATEMAQIVVKGSVFTEAPAMLGELVNARTVEIVGCEFPSNTALDLAKLGSASLVSLSSNSGVKTVTLKGCATLGQLRISFNPQLTAIEADSEGCTDDDDDDSLVAGSLVIDTNVLLTTVLSISANTTMKEFALDTLPSLTTFPLDASNLEKVGSFTNQGAFDANPVAIIGVPNWEIAKLDLANLRLAHYIYVYYTGIASIEAPKLALTAAFRVLGNTRLTQLQLGPRVADQCELAEDAAPCDEADKVYWSSADKIGRCIPFKCAESSTGAPPAVSRSFELAGNALKTAYLGMLPEDAKELTINAELSLEEVELNTDRVEALSELHLIRMTGCSSELTNMPALDRVHKSLIVTYTDCTDVQMPMLETSDVVQINYNTELAQVNMLRLTTSGSITLVGMLSGPAENADPVLERVRLGSAADEVRSISLGNAKSVALNLQPLRKIDTLSLVRILNMELDLFMENLETVTGRLTIDSMQEVLYLWAPRLSTISSLRINSNPDLGRLQLGNATSAPTAAEDNIGSISGNARLEEACIGDDLVDRVTETGNPKLPANSIGCAELAEPVEDQGCKQADDCVIPSSSDSSSIFGAIPASALASAAVAVAIVVVVIVVAVRMRTNMRKQLEAARNRPSPTPSRRSIGSLAWWDDEQSMATTVSADSISLSGIAQSATRMVKENPALAAQMLEKVYTHIYRDVAPVDDGEADDFALAASSLDEEVGGYVAVAGGEDSDSFAGSDGEYLDVDFEQAELEASYANVAAKFDEDDFGFAAE
jgi:hypothetical protein